MNLFDFIKNKIFKRNGGLTKSSNPSDPRLTFITDDEALRIEKIREFKVWYYGGASEKLNYYTNQMVYGWAVNPIYNRNNLNLFWGQSVKSTNFKRVSSDIAKAIIDTISNVVGKPTIKCLDPRIEKIIKDNKLIYRLIQEARPMTLTEGDGCWKINFNKAFSNIPLVEYYGSEDWEPIYKSQMLMGLIFKSYYKDKKEQDYVLIESRTLEPDGCLIEYNLYKIDKNSDLQKVDYSVIPELENLKDNDRFKINGVRKLFAVPNIYFYNPIYKNRGKSLLDGKITLLDTLDEILSIASQTNRVSVPVEYFDTSVLERDKQGRPIIPEKYNRNYVAVNGPTDGDGKSKGQGITTTQPDVYFEKYSQLAQDTLNYILIGNVSPSTLGIDIAKKDNADAQREKEKQTIFTRNSIIDPETDSLKELLNEALLVQDYMDTGVIVDKDYDISITYDEFANPSFESELEALGPAWSQGQISTDQYVRLLWAGKLSDEEMLKEKQYLEENKQKDDIDMAGLLNGEGNSEGLPSEGRSEGTTPETEE